MKFLKELKISIKMTIKKLFMVNQSITPGKERIFKEIRSLKDC